MKNIFEKNNRAGRKIHLTKRQWSHITTIHAEMANYLDEIQNTIKNPIKIIPHKVGDLRKYFSYQKHRKHPEKYLRVIVKYLNGDGFILTAHFIRNIK